MYIYIKHKLHTIVNTGYQTSYIYVNDIIECCELITLPLLCKHLCVF